MHSACRIVTHSPKYDAQGRENRNGYLDGSHSEIEVAANPSCGPKEIRDRSVGLLRFMEERWRLRLADSDRVNLLFLPAEPYFVRGDD